uniref:Uncharacterized protein n=1 Tax=Rhizophora mucronata TaxID=61149 RepID=A0A2P2PX02_RHIMU
MCTLHYEESCAAQTYNNLKRHANPSEYAPDI